MDYRYYETIDSTNNEAKRLISSEDITTPLLVVAKTQTAGRGRQGKSFYSPADTGLYMTLAVPMNCPIASQVTVTTRVAVAVAQTLERQFADLKIVPEIKWVNDIYVRGLKACGILCEAVNDYDRQLLKWAIIGVGVNISTQEWPGELNGIAGSIADVSVDKEALARAVALRILDLLDDMSDENYLDYYRAHSNVIGKDIEFTENGSVMQAHAVDVDATGGLMVNVLSGIGAGERRVLNSGEITVRVTATDRYNNL